MSAGKLSLGKEVEPMKRFLFIVIILFVIAKGGIAMALTLTSLAFKEGETVPKQFTCEGSDKSPALKWSDAPAGTQSFVLIMDDPDAPVGTWDHWVLFDLPAETSELPEGMSMDAELSSGAKHGLNSWKRPGYGGPCPPPGSPHRYFFKLYALDKKLGLPASSRKFDVEKAMKGHILAEAKLMGKYAR